MVEVVEFKHPLVAHHMAVLRDKATPPALFRNQVSRLATLLAVKATEDLIVRPRQVSTPMTTTTGAELDCSVAIVPILRAGLGLVEPLLELLPDAAVWHLGMYRDEATAQPVEYYSKLPLGNPADVAFVLDPMLATGGSIRAAVHALQRWGVKDIRILSLIAAQPGLDRVQEEYPEARVFVCAIDPELNPVKFIVPGLGDAGDRIFNTINE